MTPEDLRDVMLEAQHRWGRLSKVPLDFYGEVLSLARKEGGREPHEAHRAEGTIWDSTCPTCQVDGKPFGL